MADCRHWTMGRKFRPAPGGCPRGRGADRESSEASGEGRPQALESSNHGPCEGSRDRPMAYGRCAGSSGSAPSRRLRRMLDPSAGCLTDHGFFRFHPCVWIAGGNRRFRDGPAGKDAGGSETFPVTMDTPIRVPRRGSGRTACRLPVPVGGGSPRFHRRRRSFPSAPGWARKSSCRGRYWSGCRRSGRPCG